MTWQGWGADCVRGKGMRIWPAVTQVNAKTVFGLKKCRACPDQQLKIAGFCQVYVGVHVVAADQFKCATVPSSQGTRNPSYLSRLVKHHSEDGSICLPRLARAPP